MDTLVTLKLRGQKDHPASVFRMKPDNGGSNPPRLIK